LLKYISERSQKSENSDDDLTKSYEGRCMILLQGDSYVVPKNYKDQIHINIRNYHTVDDKKYPTKQGVSLTLSRWLKLKSQKGSQRPLISPLRWQRHIGYYLTDSSNLQLF